MMTFLNIFYIILIYIINIKLCLNSVSDKCDNDDEYSTFTMNCKNKTLKPALSCTQENIREDGVKCMQGTGAEKNFFGVYFDQRVAIATNNNYKFINTKLDDYNGKLNNKDSSDCTNEKLILCQQLINACILELANDKNNLNTGVCKLFTNKTLKLKYLETLLMIK